MRSANYRLVKIHRNYSVEEIASLFNAHKNTVRQWVKQGLPVLDKKRPMLIHGSDLSQFLKERRSRHKKTCKPGEIYCVRCRDPRYPVDMEADYEPSTDILGNLIGICPYCEILIYRRVSINKLDIVKGDLKVKMPHGFNNEVNAA